MKVRMEAELLASSNQASQLVLRTKKETEKNPHSYPVNWTTFIFKNKAYLLWVGERKGLLSPSKLWKHSCTCKLSPTAKAFSKDFLRSSWKLKVQNKLKSCPWENKIHSLFFYYNLFCFFVIDVEEFWMRMQLPPPIILFQTGRKRKNRTFVTHLEAAEKDPH